MLISVIVPDELHLGLFICALLDDHTTAQKAVTPSAPRQLNSAAVNVDF